MEVVQEVEKKVEEVVETVVKAVEKEVTSSDVAIQKVKAQISTFLGRVDKKSEQYLKIVESGQKFLDEIEVYLNPKPVSNTTPDAQ
jgi:ElaB/YqjD/DUF883 family membrane-anchored ribosome-binding protein